MIFFQAFMAINLKICPMKNPVFFLHGTRLLLALIITVSLSFAQTRTSAQEIAQQPASPFNLGIGFGLDYGGLGISVNYLPVKPLGLFAGLGYNLLGMGYNVGAAYRILPSKRFCPSLSAMYGYNAVISVEGEDSPYDKTYYGPSFGANLEWHSRKKPGNYFKLSLIVPLRPQAYYDDLDKLKNDPKYEVKMEPTPINLSIGYHFGL